MCLMVEYEEFDSSVHNPSYGSGIGGILNCFGIVHSIQNKIWLVINFFTVHSRQNFTEYCAQTFEYAVDATAVQRSNGSFEHRAHHMSAFDFNEKRYKVLPNIIMTAANNCV